MIGAIKPVLVCVFCAALCAIVVAVLDILTDVPFNYAVPIALIISLAPYVFLLRQHYGESSNIRSVGAVEGNQAASEHAFQAHRSQQHRPNGWTRAATIHSIVFAPVTSHRDRRGGSAQEA